MVNATDIILPHTCLHILQRAHARAGARWTPAQTCTFLRNALGTQDITLASLADGVVLYRLMHFLAPDSFPEDIQGKSGL